MAQVNTNAEAHKMLQAAHNRAYRYPQDFTGFKAVLHYSTDERNYEGNIAIQSPNDIKLEMAGEEGELKTLRHEITSLSGHRWYAPYSAGDGRYTLSLDGNAEHPLGQLVIFDNDPFKSSYRIKDGSVAQINRHVGTTRFTIYVQEHVGVEGGHTLTSQFTVAFWDTEQKRLTRTLVYTDRYVPVQCYHLPASRRMIAYDDEGVSTHLIAFSAHELM